MPRDDPWRFLMLGMLLERAEIMSRMLAVHLAADADEPQPESLASWAELLESSAALQSAEDQLSRLESDASRSVCRRLLGGVRSELEFLDGHQLTPTNLTELLG